MEKKPPETPREVRKCNRCGEKSGDLFMMPDPRDRGEENPEFKLWCHDCYGEVCEER